MCLGSRMYHFYVQSSRFVSGWVYFDGLCQPKVRSSSDFVSILRIWDSSIRRSTLRLWALGGATSYTVAACAHSPPLVGNLGKYKNSVELGINLRYKLTVFVILDFSEIFYSEKTILKVNILMTGIIQPTSILLN